MESDTNYFSPILGHKKETVQRCRYRFMKDQQSYVNFFLSE